MRKVVLIGCGNVGMSYAYALVATKNKVDELVLIDINEKYYCVDQGFNQVRIAYVLKKEDLMNALVVLGKALEAYPGRTNA